MPLAFSLPEALFPFQSANFGIRVTTEDLADLSPLSVQEATLLPPLCAPKRRLEFTAGRHVAKGALQKLGLPQAEILKDGRRPVFPKGFRGSIAHCGRHEIFACATATQENCAIGIDCEEQKMTSTPVMKRIVTQKEASVLDEIAQQFTIATAEAALAIFSAKEAVYKAVAQLGFETLGFQEVELKLKGSLNSQTLYYEAEVSRLERQVQGCLLSFEGNWLTSSFVNL